MTFLRVGMNFSLLLKILDCLFFTGDRLISVNSVSLEGVSHHAAIEILQNAPEDVTLVISQPKEKISKGNVNVSWLCVLFHCFQVLRYIDPKNWI